MGQGYGVSNRASNGMALLVKCVAQEPQLLIVEAVLCVMSVYEGAGK